MNFSHIIANQESVQKARSLVTGEQLPHAIMLTGPVGSSKLAIALSMATYILCENKTDGDSCGKCRACAKSYKLVHPDLHFSFPFIGANNTSDEFITNFRELLVQSPYVGLESWVSQLGAENKQLNINTKECRNIITKLNYQTFESTHKILIIWLPEYLRKEGNRLLKLIEEPTDNTHIILVTDNQEMLLPTIISRCQILKIKPPSDQYLMDVLTNKYGVEVDKAKELIFLSEGNTFKAIAEMSDSTVGLHEEIMHWFRLCYSRKSDDLVNWVEQFAKKTKEEIKRFFQYALNFLREVARVPILDKNSIRLNEKEHKTAEKMSTIVTFDEIEQLSRILSESFYYVERNANIKILMMDVSLQFTNILRLARQAS